MIHGLEFAVSSVRCRKELQEPESQRFPWKQQLPGKALNARYLKTIIPAPSAPLGGFGTPRTQGPCPHGRASGSSPSLRSFARLSWALLFLSHPKPGTSSRWLLSHFRALSFRALQQKVLSMTEEDGALGQRGGSTTLGGEGAHWPVGQGGTRWDTLGHRLTAGQPRIPSP